MPNRILKESICYSDDVDQLTPFEETVFYRLIVCVDDYGRLDARTSFLRSTLFKTKDSVTKKNVEDAVTRLASVGLVRLYEVDGKPFLLFPKWEKHQQIRAKKSKFPAPDSGFSDMKSSDINCNQVISDVTVIQSNPNTESNPSGGGTRDDFSLQPEQVEDIRKIGEAYELDIGAIPSSAMYEFREYYLSHGISADVIIKAIQTAAENNARKWPYIRTILERCITEKVITIQDWEQAELRKKSGGDGGASSGRPDKKHGISSRDTGRIKPTLGTILE